MIHSYNSTLPCSKSFNPNSSIRYFNIGISEVSDFSPVSNIFNTVKNPNNGLKVNIDKVKTGHYQELIRQGKYDLIIDHVSESKCNLKYFELYSDGFCEVFSQRKTNLEQSGQLNMKSIVLKDILEVGLELGAITSDYVNELTGKFNSLHDVLDVVSQGKFRTILPKQVYKHLGKRYQLTSKAIYRSDRTLAVNMVYHPSYNQDKSHIWLRNVIKEEYKK